ncbi:MAG: hypothetical protein KJ000_11855 [Pirellulaceae bacterium]|jgi:adenine deaminase|nr:hypothetical protein [Pirellulaceae bacterium]
MADIVRLEDLKTEEITELLAANGRRLAEDQAAVIHHSASQICDLKRAFDLLQSLQKLDKAA